MINLGPSWRGGGTTTVLGPPPGPSATVQSWGAGNVERRMAQNSGSSWGSRRVLRVPTLAFLKAETSVPGSQGLLGGGGRLFKASSRQIRSGRWRWAASLLGSLSGSGGAGAYPQLSPGSGRVRPAGSGLTWAARGPLLKSWDPTRRSAAPREPRLCAHRHPPPSCSG